ncbi:MAG TPA: ABC transporter permease, partial [bacterium]|nr:ABC transporter permease [bacterium]
MNLRSELIRTFAFTYRNFTMMRRNIFMLLDMVYWPFIAVLSIGFMLAFLKPGDKNVSVVLSGVIAMSVLQTCQLDVSYSLLFEMWSKSMKHTIVAPVSGRHYILGAWLFGIVRGTVTFLILDGFIYLLFKFNMM